MTLTFFLALFLNTDVWGLMKMYWNTKQFKSLGPTSAKSRGPNLNFSISRLLCILTSFWVLGAPESWSNYFFLPFSTFFADFKPLSLKWTKKVENVWKKEVQPALGCAQHPKPGRNTQQTYWFVITIQKLDIYVWFSYVFVRHFEFSNQKLDIFS